MIKWDPPSSSESPEESCGGAAGSGRSEFHFKACLVICWLPRSLPGMWVSCRSVVYIKRRFPYKWAMPPDFKSSFLLCSSVKCKWEGLWLRLLSLEAPCLFPLVTPQTCRKARKMLLHLAGPEGTGHGGGGPESHLSFCCTDTYSLGSHPWPHPLTEEKPALAWLTDGSAVCVRIIRKWTLRMM